MASASETLKQEMPPVGGYRPLIFDRQFSKRVVTFPMFAAFTAATSVLWYYFYRINRKMVVTKELEDRSTNISIEPALLAERDREYLRQLRRNRDEEAELMKNYPGWVVGTYFGEPIYHTLPEDYIVDPDINAYYVHTRYKYLSEYMHLTQQY